MCGFILMPDGVHGSDKIHTLVALYTSLLSNRRQHTCTHIHTRTHTHTHTLTHMHAHMHTHTTDILLLCISMYLLLHSCFVVCLQHHKLSQHKVKFSVSLKHLLVRLITLLIIRHFTVLVYDFFLSVKCC